MSQQQSGISKLVSALVIIIIVLGTGLAYEFALNQSTTTYTETRVTTSYITEMSSPPSIFNLATGFINVSDYGAYPPQWITYNPSFDSIFLAGGPNIMVINAKTKSVTGNFSLPGIYTGIYEVDPQTNTLYLLFDTCGNATMSSCQASDIKTNLAEVNGTSGALIRQLPLPDGSFLAVNYRTNTVYEADFCPNTNPLPGVGIYSTGCGYLLAISGETGNELANISLGQAPWSIAVDQTTNMVYTTDGIILLTINGTSDSIQSRTALRFSGSTPVIRVDAATNVVYALGVNGSSTVLAAVGGTTGNIIYSSEIGSACLVDSDHFYVNSFTNQIYADAGLASENLVYINASSGKITNIVSIPGHSYSDSTFNQKLNETYALLNGTIAVLPSHLSQYYNNASYFGSSHCTVGPVF